MCILFISPLSVYGMSYEYDQLDRVTKVTYEDGSYTTFSYDKNGNIIKTENHEKAIEDDTDETPEPSVTPEPSISPEPSVVPTNAPTVSPTNKPSNTPKPQQVDTVTGAASVNEEYTIKAQSKSGTFELHGLADGTHYAVFEKPKSKTVKTVTVPASINYDGVDYPVTIIAKNAFAGNTKMKKVTVGSNIQVIEANAFKGCKSLKKIAIKSKVVERVGKNAFKGIHKNAVIKVPKSKLKEYTKIFQKKGQKKTVKIKK